MLPDTTDLNALRAFFEKHQYYNTYELAVLTGRAPSTIDNWRVKCGVRSGKKPPTTIKRKIEIQSQIPINPEIWDNKNWFQSAYDTRVGMPTIARIIGRSVTLVAKRLNRYGIATRDQHSAMASKNPYCIKQWLLDTYVDKNWTLRQCAILAGVSPHTISKWLTKFGIPIRDINEAMAGERNPFFGRRHTIETKERLQRAYKANGYVVAGPARVNSIPATIKCRQEDKV